MTEPTFDTMQGLTETEMPSGKMIASGPLPTNSTGGEMPNGRMGTLGTSTETGFSASDMPRGEMNQNNGMAGGLSVSDMPSGRMTDSTVTVSAFTGGEMPVGTMTDIEKVATALAGTLPTMELTGEWHLTLSTTSLKSS